MRQGDRNLSRLLALLSRVPVLPVPGGGRHLQQPVHVADVADAVLSAAERPASAGRHVRHGRPGAAYSFAELLRASRPRRSAAGPASCLLPLAALVAAARCYELLAACPRIRAEQLQRLAEDKAFAIDDAARDLGYAPRPFADGILAEARALGLATVTASDLALLARTAAHLQPGQITQRARLRAQRTALRRFPPARRWLMAGPDPAARSAGPPGSARSTRGSGGTGRVPGLRARPHRPARHDQALAGPAPGDLGDHDDPVGAGWMRPTGRRPTGQQADWEHAAAPALWRFHLHYWDWAWRLAAEPDRADARAWFAAMWRSWHAPVRSAGATPGCPIPPRCGPGRSAASPGPGRGQPDRGLLHRQPVCPRRVPEAEPRNRRRRQPPDQEPQGARGLACSSATSGCCGQALDQLTGQLAVQVLPDGGHYERAPAYHCQVLADLIDVAELLRCRGPGTRPGTAGRDQPDALLAELRDLPGRAGSAAQRRLPGRPGLDRRPAGPACPRAEPAAGAAGHRPGPGGGRQLAPAGRRRCALPGGTAGARPRGHAELPGPGGRRAAAGRHRHVHVRTGSGPQLRAVHRGAQHPRGGRGRLDRGLGGVPGRPAGPGHRASPPARPTAAC